jgi:hypothetical protein
MMMMMMMMMMVMMMMMMMMTMRQVRDGPSRLAADDLHGGAAGRVSPDYLHRRRHHPLARARLHQEWYGDVSIIVIRIQEVNIVIIIITLTLIISSIIMMMIIIIIIMVVIMLVVIIIMMVVIFSLPSLSPCTAARMVVAKGGGQAVKFLLNHDTHFAEGIAL